VQQVTARLMEELSPEQLQAFHSMFETTYDLLPPAEATRHVESRSSLDLQLMSECDVVA
jgi:hypothetical protein